MSDCMQIPAISVRNVSHTFASRQVLNNVSFEVSRGDIFGFIGPNGAGKTTTLRMMATLIEPQSGCIEIDGLDVTIDTREVRKRLGYMADHPCVYEQLSVREYLDFFAAAHRVTEANSVVDAVLDLTDLRRISDRVVTAISKGMKQRLQLARTLLHDPSVLILDEPASDLDPRARIEMRDLILELRKMGKTILLSSHILTELSDLCTSIAILEQGSIVIAGPIDEIAAQLDSRKREAPRPHPALLDKDMRATPTKNKSAKIRVLCDSKHAATVLRAGGHCGELMLLGAGSLLVRYGPDERSLARCVTQLVQAGIAVAAVEPQVSDLERVFLESTRGEQQ
jgi:ABC-2 type transport system ATP-binding protein